MTAPACYREAPSNSFNVGSTQVPKDRGVIVVGADAQRRSVLVVNTAASADVFVTNSQSAPPDAGYRLAPGEGLELRTGATVYAVCRVDGGSLKWVAESGAI